MGAPYTYLRSAWEEPGWTVDEHTGSPPVNWSWVDTVVIHYTAATDVPDGDADELPWFNFVRAKIRATQRDYAANRGYSIGYNVVVAQDGSIWQTRGAEFMCAANKGTLSVHRHADQYPDPDRHNCNLHTFAILMLVDANDPARPETIEAVRSIVAWVRSQATKPVKIVGHKDIGATGCPGDGLYAQVRYGVFEPQVAPPPPPPAPEPAPTPEETDMSEYVKVDAADTALLVRDGRLVSWVSDGAMLAHIKASNTIATARVLSAGECAALGFVGPLPHYSADSGAGVKRCTRELWAFAE